MIEFYPQIKFVHVLCVVLSGTVFALRGVLMLMPGSSSLANHVVVRYVSYAIDSALLTAALMLVTILHQYPFVQAWLTAKVLLLVVYIVLGVFALRPGRTRAVRSGFFIAALASFAFIASIARTHNPWGVFAGLVS